MLRRALVRADLHDVDDSEAPLTGLADALDTTDVTLRSPLARGDLLRLIALIELVEVDTKWKACAGVLHSRLPPLAESGLILCDFADTASYVAGLVAGTGIQLS